MQRPKSKIQYDFNITVTVWKLKNFSLRLYVKSEDQNMQFQVLTHIESLNVDFYAFIGLFAG